MKKYIFRLFFLCGLMSGICLGQEAVQADNVKVPQGIVGKEKAAWSKGIAAAKKRHWNRQRLTAQEKSYYNALLKRVGTIAGIVALIGAGTYAKKRRDLVADWNREYERREQERAAAARGAEQAREAEQAEWNAFLVACEAGDLDQKGANECLNRIIRSNDRYDERMARAVQEILRNTNGLDLEQMDHDGTTLLLEAMGHYQVYGWGEGNQHAKDIVAALIEADADVTLTNIDGNSPLLMAVFREDKPLVEALIDRGAGQDEDELSTVLFQMVQGRLRNVPIIKKLVESGANPDREYPAGEETVSARDLAKRFGYSERIFNISGAGRATKSAAKR